MTVIASRKSAADRDDHHDYEKFGWRSFSACTMTSHRSNDRDC